MSDKMSIPAWFKEVLEMSEKERKELVNEILQAISREGSLNDKPTKSGLALVKMLKNECELGGFSPNLWYCKHQGKSGELRDTFIHKWGYPTLVYKHKNLPITLQVNPGMRKDQMLLKEIPGNRGLFEGVYVVGWTS
jgi:hypothetical protein